MATQMGSQRGPRYHRRRFRKLVRVRPTVGDECVSKNLDCKSGEVARRILRTCKRLGVEVVVVTSLVDKNQHWLAEADHVACIGPAAARDSYLNQDAILEVAQRYRVSAIHPGWGFLAENAEFARRCETMGIQFIGPSARHILEMGDKSLARKTMADLECPLSQALETQWPMTRRGEWLKGLAFLCS